MDRWKKFRVIKQKIGIPEIYIESAVAGDFANRRYCSKEDNSPWQFGTPIKQGQRTDLKKYVKIYGMEKV